MQVLGQILQVMIISNHAIEGTQLQGVQLTQEVEVETSDGGTRTLAQGVDQPDLEGWLILSMQQVIKQALKQ